MNGNTYRTPHKLTRHIQKTPRTKYDTTYSRRYRDNKTYSRFQNHNRREGESGYNSIVSIYNNTIYKAVQLNKAMDASQVEKANELGEQLFRNKLEYKNLSNLYVELCWLQNKIKYDNYVKLDKLTTFVFNFLNKAQTGDVLPLPITTTETGNLATDILNLGRLKLETPVGGKKTKKHRKKKSTRKKIKRKKGTRKKLIKGL